jgi:hypothetical protein
MLIVLLLYTSAYHTECRTQPVAQHHSTPPIIVTRLPAAAAAGTTQLPPTNPRTRCWAPFASQRRTRESPPSRLECRDRRIPVALIEFGRKGPPRSRTGQWPASCRSRPTPARLIRSLERSRWRSVVITVGSAGWLPRLGCINNRCHCPPVCPVCGECQLSIGNDERPGRLMRAHLIACALIGFALFTPAAGLARAPKQRPEIPRLSRMRLARLSLRLRTPLERW